MTPSLATVGHFSLSDLVGLEPKDKVVALFRGLYAVDDESIAEQYIKRAARLDVSLAELLLRIVHLTPRAYGQTDMAECRVSASDGGDLTVLDSIILGSDPNRSEILRDLWADQDHSADPLPPEYALMVAELNFDGSVPWGRYLRPSFSETRRGENRVMLANQSKTGYLIAVDQPDFGLLIGDNVLEHAKGDKVLFDSLMRHAESKRTHPKVFL